MTIEINYNKQKTVKITSDTDNPRIYIEEIKCHVCKNWFDKEDIVWATNKGILSTDKGNPYCSTCVPDEEK